MENMRPRPPIDHHLKTADPYYDEVQSGMKPFELRKNDRDYRVGDRLILYKYDQHLDIWTKPCVLLPITYVLDTSPFGLPGHVILAWGGPSVPFAFIASLLQARIARARAAAAMMVQGSYAAMSYYHLFQAEVLADLLRELEAVYSPGDTHVHSPEPTNPETLDQPPA